MNAKILAVLERWLPFEDKELLVKIANNITSLYDIGAEPPVDWSDIDPVKWEGITTGIWRINPDPPNRKDWIEQPDGFQQTQR